VSVRSSEPFKQPRVRAAAGFPERHVLPISRGNGPAQVLLVFLEERSSLPAQVHAQQDLRLFRRPGRHPQTAAIGFPSRLEIPLPSGRASIRSLPLAREKRRIFAFPGTRCFLANASMEPLGDKLQFCKYHSGPRESPCCPSSNAPASPIVRLRRADPGPAGSALFKELEHGSRSDSFFLKSSSLSRRAEYLTRKLSHIGQKPILESLR
jgi:hypothetical protein